MRLMVPEPQSQLSQVVSTSASAIASAIAIAIAIKINYANIRGTRAR